MSSGEDSGPYLIGFIGTGLSSSWLAGTILAGSGTCLAPVDSSYCST